MLVVAYAQPCAYRFAIATALCWRTDEMLREHQRDDAPFQFSCGFSFSSEEVASTIFQSRATVRCTAPKAQSFPLVPNLILIVSFLHRHLTQGFAFCLVATMSWQSCVFFRSDGSVQRACASMASLFESPRRLLTALACSTLRASTGCID